MLHTLSLCMDLDLGGLNIANPCKNVASQHNTSTCISAPLTALIIQQNSSYSRSMKMEQQREKPQIKNHQQKEQENQVATLYRQLPEQMQWKWTVLVRREHEAGFSQRSPKQNMAMQCTSERSGTPYVCGMDDTQDICPQNVCSKQFTVNYVFVVAFRHCATMRSEMLQQTLLMRCATM